MSVTDATEKAIQAATHLTDMDAGAVETILALALKIDLMDDYLEALSDDAAESNGRPPSPDNVSIPTYLKYCESLGLTPAGRARIGDKKPEGTGGKLALLQGQAKAARTKAG